MNGQLILDLSPRPVRRRLLRRWLEAVNYLPIKIKMPAMSAKTPVTIAPMPT